MRILCPRPLELISVVTVFLGVFLVNLETPAGELRVESLSSKSLSSDAVAAAGVELKLNVLLPDDYDAASDRRFPVIYLLHGYGGNYREWERVGVVEEAKGLPAIIVMPEGDKSFYINHADDSGARWGDYIVDDVVSFIDGKYRTIASRAGRGISGLSMGGFGAVALGLRYADKFATVASHSGAVGILKRELSGEIAERIRRIFGPAESETRSAFDPLKSLAKLTVEQRPHLYIDCGSSDFLLESNREFIRELSSRGIAYEYREVPGGHDFSYWKSNVRYSLTRQLAAIDKALASAPAEGSAAKVSIDSVVGRWNAHSTLPDGTESESVLRVERRGVGISARAEWNDGANGLDLDIAELRGDRLELEGEIERDGEKLSLRVEAKLVDATSLEGKWMVLSAVGAELFSGAWKAKKDAILAKPSDRKLDGKWNLVLDFAGQNADYGLRLRTSGSGLEAVLISPRSGEHPVRKAVFADGKFELEVDRNLDGSDVTFLYEGRLEGEKLSGTFKVRPFEDQYSGSWSATRSAETP
jgi:putative tributyrin esterase